MQDGKRPTSPAGARPAASPTPPTSINRAMHDVADMTRECSVLIAGIITRTNRYTRRK